MLRGDFYDLLCLIVKEPRTVGWHVQFRYSIMCFDRLRYVLRYRNCQMLPFLGACATESTIFSEE